MKKQPQEKGKDSKRDQPKDQPKEEKDPKQDIPSIQPVVNVINEELKAKQTPALPSINTSQPIMQSTFYSKKFNNTTGYLHSNLSCPTLNFQLSKTGLLFRKLSSNKKFHIKPTKRRGNGIPDTLLERLRLFSTIFKDEAFVLYYQRSPLRDNGNIDVIVKYITNYTGSHGEFDRFAMIFYYLCNQITYDRDNSDKGKDQKKENKNKDKKDKEYKAKPENVLKSGIANSEGFSSLFEYFCKYIKLSFKRIEGYCKYFGFKIGHGCAIVNHSWHRIRIKNEWYLCDVTLGSGGNQKKDIALNYFNPFYFLTPPEVFIDSHRPLEDEMQMNTKTVILKQFASKSNHFLGDFYQKVYEKDIELLTHDHPFISIPDKVLNIQIRIKDVALQANLFTASGKTKLGEIKYIMEENDSKYSFDVKFPGTGTYVVSIISRSSTSTDLIYYPLINYSVKVGEDFTFKRQVRSIGKSKDTKGRDIGNDNTLLQHRHTIQSSCKILSINGKLSDKPTKKICLDNTNAYLFEPKTSQLLIGNEIRFKVKIKGALAVIVLDGRKWNYLKKKDEDIWEGVAMIQTENVSICSLKTCNVFTEVFLFKATKA